MSKLLDDASIETIKLEGGYSDLRQLPDGTIVGIGRLLYTTAVYVGVGLEGWRHRFCFDDAELALSEYCKLQSGQDEPNGWIARRPQQPD